MTIETFLGSPKKIFNVFSNLFGLKIFQKQIYFPLLLQQAFTFSTLQWFLIKLISTFFLFFFNNSGSSAKIFINFHTLHCKIKTIKQIQKILTITIDLIMQVIKKLSITNNILQHKNAEF